MLTPPRQHSLTAFSFGSILHSRKNVIWSEVKWSRSVMSDSLRPHGLYPNRLLHPWDFPGKNTGVGCHFLLQCHLRMTSKTTGTCSGITWHQPWWSQGPQWEKNNHILILCPIFHLKRIGLLLASQEGGQSLDSISWLWHSFSSVQSLSPVWLFVTPWTAPRQASLPFTKSQNLLKLMSTEPVMPSSYLILCHPLLLPSSIFPSIRVFSNESVLHIRWPKDWSFSFSSSPSNEYSGLISLRMDWLDLFAAQGTLKSLLQHHSSKSSVLRHSAFFIVQLLHPYLLLEKPLLLLDSTWQCLCFPICCLGGTKLFFQGVSIF